MENLLQIPALYNSYAKGRPINLNGNDGLTVLFFSQKLGCCLGENILCTWYQDVKFSYLGFVINLFFCAVVAESSTQNIYLLSLTSIF